jgi:hypothetical protein
MWIVIFMVMDKIRDFIMDNFTPRVNEDSRGMKVVFTSQVGEGTIWFERAKMGWSRKPLSTNNYIIVDAELTHILTFLNRYYQINEEHYQDIRRMFIDIGMDIMDKHIRGDKPID